MESTPSELLASSGPIFRVKHIKSSTILVQSVQDMMIYVCARDCFAVRKQNLKNKRQTQDSAVDKNFSNHLHEKDKDKEFKIHTRSAFKRSSPGLIILRN